jgi:hypothetical protein
MWGLQGCLLPDYQGRFGFGQLNARSSDVSLLMSTQKVSWITSICQVKLFVFNDWQLKCAKIENKISF